MATKTKRDGVARCRLCLGQHKNIQLIVVNQLVHSTSLFCQRLNVHPANFQRFAFVCVVMIRVFLAMLTYCHRHQHSWGGDLCYWLLLWLLLLLLLIIIDSPQLCWRWIYTMGCEFYYYDFFLLFFCQRFLREHCYDKLLTHIFQNFRSSCLVVCLHIFVYMNIVQFAC